jgi:hypothetical protein
MSTDLVPSRAALLVDIDSIFEKLAIRGVGTWFDLQVAIKNPKNLEAFAIDTGIEREYLVLLRREIEGYRPKIFNLSVIDWVPQEVIKKLIDDGITTSEQLFSSVTDKDLRNDFADKVGIDHQMMDYLANLVSLCLVQWVSPTPGRMLIEAGYETPQKLSDADGNELFEAMDRVNKKGQYFKGTIGLRDIKRLIEAAKYML